MKDKLFPSDYKPFLQDILTKIQSARYEMLMSVSKQTLLLYWDIGKMVSEKIELAGWGKSVVEQLAKDLQTEIPGVRGFSARNIRNMKRFYEFYATCGISATTVAKIELPNNSATAVAELEIEENHSSSAVTIISASTEEEMQMRVYDLVTSVGWMQNRIILEKCKDLKQPHHNNTIGIVLCRTKNRLEVEYVLELAKDPMGVATYNRYSQLPEEYAKYLPSEEELGMRLSEFIPKNN